MSPRALLLTILLLAVGSVRVELAFCEAVKMKPAPAEESSDDADDASPVPAQRLAPAPAAASDDEDDDNSPAAVPRTPIAPPPPASAAAVGSFAALDLNILRRQVVDYRRKANLLRARVGVRQRDVNQAEGLANQVMRNAQAQAAAAQAQAQAAQNTASTASNIANIASMFPGGGNWGKIARMGANIGASAAQANADAATAQANAQAQAAINNAQGQASTLEQRAKELEGEQKRLAMKARQYEYLADAKDLLLAAETLRLQSVATSKDMGRADQSISSANKLVDEMDLW